MEVRKKIKGFLMRVLGELRVNEGVGGVEGEIKLEHSGEEAHGDYSSNIAMAIFSKSKIKKTASLGGQNAKFTSPQELAKTIVEHLEQDEKLKDYVEKVEVATPGFINFFLKKEVLVSALNDSVKENYGKNILKKGKKIMVEYTDPNPFKEFHIGHLFTNTVGESVARLFEAQGASVVRANYQGDVGLHVAKAIYGVKSKLKIPASTRSLIGRGEQNLKFKTVENMPLEERVKFLGEAYAVGDRAYTEIKGADLEIKDLNKKIYERDPEILEIYDNGKKWSLEAFEKLYKKLGTKFDYYYFESDTGKSGASYVRKFLEKGIFIEDGGAVIFPGEKYGLHNRVFINSQGLPTYEAKDLGLAETKYNDFAYDDSFIVTANEISDYFKVILKVLSLTNPLLGEKNHHLAHGMLKLATGKMSSRTGNIVTAESLLGEVKDKLIMAHPEMEADVQEIVAVGAVKCALLKPAIGSDVVFDADKSISFEGDSGPYLQYTYARIRSVISKAQSSKLKAQNLKVLDNNLSAYELELIRKIYQFPAVVADAGEKIAPNIVVTYLFEIASLFNTFYSKNRILGGENESVRLAVAFGTGNILKTGLGLLGIKTPSKM